MTEIPGGGSMCAVHLSVPAVGTCARCGAFACADCLVSLPDGSRVCRRCEARTRQTALPWDRRSELGFWRAYWQTSVAVISKPGLTFGAMPKDGSLGSSLLFTAVAQSASFATTLVLYALVFVGMMVFAPDDPQLRKLFGELGRGGGLAIGVAGAMVAVFIYLALLAVMAVVGQLVGGSIEHGLLKLLGGKGSWTETMRGFSMALGPAVVGLVPVCGIYAFPIWCIVMRVFAYRHVHEISWGKAVVGAVVPTAAFFCCLGSAYVALLSVVFSGKG